MDELLDIVDEQDNVIGQKWRSEIYAKSLNYFRAVNAFVENDKGQFWIPRRIKEKPRFPLYLDASVSGHVAAGESYEEAFKRELLEELRLNSDLIDYRQIGTLNPVEHGVAAFMHVYVIHYNQNPDYNPDVFLNFFG